MNATVQNPNQGAAIGISLVTLAVVLSMALGRAMAGDEFMEWIGLPAALGSSLLAWWVMTTPRARVRFEVPFWGGLLFLGNAAELAWHVEERISAHPKGSMQQGWEIWLPMLCAYSLFAGIILILWASQQWQPAIKARAPGDSRRAGR